jgi:hypothetical protein
MHELTAVVAAVSAASCSPPARENLGGVDDCGFNSAAIVDFLIETRSLPALARRYHRDFTFYVACPISSIFPSYFILPSRERAGPNRSETDIALSSLLSLATDQTIFATFCFEVDLKAT